MRGGNGCLARRTCNFTRDARGADQWGEPISNDFWQNLVRLVDWVAANWCEPDEGIWETRKGRQEFLYSRLMCWVPMDRGIRLARKRSLPAPLARWEEARDAIYQDIFANFWDEEQQTFVQHRGSKTVECPYFHGYSAMMLSGIPLLIR